MPPANLHYWDSPWVVARNLGTDNIRVNMLLPGSAITEMTKDWSAERCQQIAEGSFFKLGCAPIEIAEVIAFLLSPANRYMTGSIVDMTAGSMWGTLMTSQIHVALIGMGSQGKEHIDAAQKHTQIKIIAGVESSPEARQALAQTYPHISLFDE